jgi:hypothetical protein
MSFKACKRSVSAPNSEPKTILGVGPLWISIPVSLNSARTKHKPVSSWCFGIKEERKREIPTPFWSGRTNVEISKSREIDGAISGRE